MMLNQPVSNVFALQVYGNCFIAGDSVQAGKDFTLSTLQVENSHDITRSQHNYLRQSSSAELGTQISGGGAVSTVKSSNGLADEGVSLNASGNVAIQSGATYTQTGSDVLAPAGDIAISAKEVNILEARQTNAQSTEQQFKQSGLTLAITSPVVSALQTVQSQLQAANNTKSARMQALAGANVGFNLMKASDAITVGQGDVNGQVPTGKTLPNGKPEMTDGNAADKAGGIGISVSLGSSKSQSNTSQRTNTAAASTVAAGGDVRIEATQDNLTVQGSSISAGNTAQLSAAQDINLLASQDTSTQSNTSSNSSASVGIAMQLGAGGSGVGFTAAAAKGSGRGAGDATTYNNTLVSAVDEVALRSGGDTTLHGAVVTADQVTANIGGNLLIQSLQDTDTYNDKSQQIGGSVMIGAGGGGSLNFSKTRISSDYASVTQQSAIRAEDAGFNVDVGGNTTLNGGAITSTQAAVDNQANSFSTGTSGGGTLTTSDIANTASYSAESHSIGMGTSGMAGITGAGIGSDSGSANSTTLASISGIAGNKSARTGDAEGGIAKVFDQEAVTNEVNAQVTITSEFGKNASKAVGDYATTKLKEAQAAGDKQAIADWEEGGVKRVALHAVVGGLTGGTTGAVGATAASAAAPHLENLQHQFTQALMDAGTGYDTAKAIAGLASGVTAAGIGTVASGGTVAGAATAFNADMNNRQLHPTEKQRIKDLAKGDAQKEARLSAAACALVKCYAEHPEGSVAYNTLKAMADVGSSDAMATERQQLQGQQGMFGYTTQGVLSDKNIDAAKQVNNTYQVTTRALGAGQAVLGGLGVAGSVVSAPASCATGVGCVANAVVGTLSADTAYAGAKQVVSGQPENTSLNNALQGMGLSPEAASYAEFALGVGAAAKVGSVVNAATATQTANNTAARMSYEDIAKFGAKGLNATPEVMQTPQARALMAEYQAAGVSTQFAEDLAKGVFQTGKDIPTIRVVGANEELIKVVPKSSLADDGVSKVSPYFMTRAEYDSLSKLSPAEISQRLGLPAEQGSRGAQLGFEAYSITPKPGTSPTVFTSTVAPIEQGAYNAAGGAQQTVVPNRSLWTEPKSIGSVGGKK